MKFGLCCPLAEAEAALNAGFDYVELPASGFGGRSINWDASPYEGLPILATNVFFDSRIKLFDPEPTPYLDYAKRTIERGAELDVSCMVIGSGTARRAPVPDDEGFVEIVAEIANLAKPYGIAIAPESLNRTETNVGNDLRRLALLLREKGVGYTADSYHVLFEWDSDGRLFELAQLFAEQLPHAPTHVHIADLPRTGVAPGDPMLQAFVARLHTLGYDGNVSLECSRPAGFGLRESLRDLEDLFG